MVTMYLRVVRMGCSAANWGPWKSGRSFLTLCATPIQHKTEENQGSLNTAKTTKCPAENTVQHKMNSSPCAGQSMLQLKMNELDREYRTLQDNYRRVLAHAEDTNRRVRKCVEDARIYGIHSFCKDILAVADLLEKITQNVTEVELANSTPTVKNLCEGLCLINEKLCQIFAKHGLEKMNSFGRQYNSAEHEIVSRVPSVEALPGTVVKIVQEGYKLHGRILRTAQVGLAIETQPHLRKGRSRS
ncbi:grpE protein homolog 2, mitochondrial-like [Pristis pectinata]|uniref:grpE protein homolog 2, mitochondrial-like n=1 Tax=Pristis pectinata TaxID=685728 RepID=UPI00223CB6A9|nr:grpE protein homolog 2, mitochondrial-like [Pristis pectinata]